MKRLVLLFSVFVLIIGCNTTAKKLIINGNIYEIYNPPATKKIESNVYVDVAEISNIDYKEYLYWIKRIHGFDSKEFFDAGINTSVWKLASEELQKYESEYFKDEKYNNHPVVGINLSQGENYTNWRSDRVAEMLLIRKGYIEISPEQKKDNHFTIERYMSGKYKWTKKQVEKMAFPIYKIPTQTDYEKYILNDVAEQMKNDKEFEGNKKLVKKGLDLYNLKKLNGSNTKEEGPKNRIGYAKTSKGLTHVIGNVSEMISSENKSMGGNWTTELKDIKTSNGENFVQENYYTGLRNICIWEERVLKSF